MNNNNYRS